MSCTMYSCDVSTFERSLYDYETREILSFDMNYDYVWLSSMYYLVHYKFVVLFGVTFYEILLGNNASLL